MKLATVFTDTGPRLHVLGAGGLLDVADVAAAQGLSTFEDVGSLFRAGEAAVAAVRRFMAEVDETQVSAIPPESARLGPPVLAPSKVIGIGLNYGEHAKESGKPLPAKPLLFAKLPSSLIGDGAAVRYPAVTDQLDYEGELAVVMGRRARSVTQSDAMRYVGGYTILNDISARDLQFAEAQWIRGKSLDTFGPVGPYCVTPDEIGDVGALHITTTVNGEIMQDADCEDLIFSVEQLIAFITEAITLEPGDIITTGTPSGVGNAQRPPRYLRVGDVVEVSVSRIGSLRSPIQDGRGVEEPSGLPLGTAAKEGPPPRTRSVPRVVGFEQRS